VRAIFVLIFTAFLCSGCALTTATIEVPYQSLTPAAAVPGANGVTVSVSTTDGRTTNRDRVGSKKNGYGMDMAAIVASNNIPDTVGDAFKQELTARGFKIGPNGVSLQIELVQFYNDFKIGFFAGDAVANVAFNVEILTPGGTIEFSKYYQGTGDNPNIQIAGGDNAQIALIKAFQDAVASAVQDPAFIQALIKAGAALPTS
jgi:uncharacterized lipoprotein